MDRLRIGMVGCGEVTQVIHLPTLTQLSSLFTVTGLCDINKEVLDGVGDRWSIKKRYTSAEELIHQADVDAVLIANPHAYHARTVLAAIRAGKHVLVEKPMCISLREADEIIEAQKQSDVIIQVGYMRRYAPAFLKACQMVQELSGMGTLHESGIHLARVHDVIGKNALIIRRTSNVIREKEKDVPLAVLEERKALQKELVNEAVGDVPEELERAYLVLLGLSSHDISAMRELLGMPNEVLYSAQRHRGLYISAAFDYGDFVCHFETGVDNIPRFDGHLEVYGINKVIRVQYDTPYVRNLPIRLLVTEVDGEGGVTNTSSHPSWGDPFIAEWQAFHESVTKRVQPKTHPADFRKDLEIFREMMQLMPHRSSRQLEKEPEVLAGSQVALACELEPAQVNAQEGYQQEVTDLPSEVSSG